MTAYFRSGRNVLRLVGTLTIALGIAKLGLHPLGGDFARAADHYDYAYCYTVSAQCATCSTPNHGEAGCDSQIPPTWNGGFCAGPTFYEHECDESDVDCGLKRYCDEGNLPTGSACYSGSTCK